MTSFAYKLLGLAVWRGARWYLRRRVRPRRRGLVTRAVMGAMVLLAGAAVARRLTA